MEDEIKTAPEAVTSSETPSGSPSAATSDALGAMLANPELLARLPQIMAAIKPMLGSLPVAEHGAEKADEKADEKKEPPPPTLCREQLLLALKPFLSRERCDAVDTILRLSKLGAVFQLLK